MADKRSIKVKTFCDFGAPLRKEVLGKHYTLKAAVNQYKRLWDIYHRIHGWTVWQEEVNEDKKVLETMIEDYNYRIRRLEGKVFLPKSPRRSLKYYQSRAVDELKAEVKK